MPEYANRCEKRDYKCVTPQKYSSTLNVAGTSMFQPKEVVCYQLGNIYAKGDSFKIV